MLLLSVVTTLWHSCSCRVHTQTDKQTLCKDLHFFRSDNGTAVTNETKLVDPVVEYWEWVSEQATVRYSMNLWIIEHNSIFYSSICVKLYKVKRRSWKPLKILFVVIVMVFRWCLPCVSKPGRIPRIYVLHFLHAPLVRRLLTSWLSALQESLFHPCPEDYLL